MLGFIGNLGGIFVSFFIFGMIVDRKGRKGKVEKHLFLLFLFPLLMFGVNFISTVPANHVGIVYNAFGGVQEKTVPEGISFKNPLDKIYTIPTSVRTVTVSDQTGQTKDAQWINMALDIKYSVSSENAFTVFRQFRSLSRVDSELIIPISQRAIEVVTTKYNVIEILGEKRAEVYDAITKELSKELAQSGINLYSMTLVDTDAGAALEEAISKEAVAKKEAETAVQAQEKARVDAETAKIKAQAEADVKVITAKGEAEANNIVANSLSDNILKQMEMEARLKHGWLTTNAGAVIANGD